MPVKATATAINSSSTPLPKERLWNKFGKTSTSPLSGKTARPSTPSLSLLHGSMIQLSITPLPQKAAAAAGRHSLQSMIMQDFLAGAFKDTPASGASGELPLPPTVLSLSSSGVVRPGLECSGIWPGPPNCNSDSGNPIHVAAGGSYSACSALLFSRKLVGDDPSCISGGDRRYKRMIKNRESAARSRARKQAYTNELEQKVAHLTAENIELNKQNKKLRLAMAAQLPKRKGLRRTLSDLF